MSREPEAWERAIREVKNIEFPAWHRAYRDALALRDFLFERWRNDPSLYYGAQCPQLGDMFEVVFVNA